MTSMTTYKPYWIREDFIDFIGEKSIQPGHSKVKVSVVNIQAVSSDFSKSSYVQIITLTAGHFRPVKISR